MFQLNQFELPGPETQMTLAKVEIDPHGAHQMLTPLEEWVGTRWITASTKVVKMADLVIQKQGHVFGIHRLGRSLGLNEKCVVLVRNRQSVYHLSVFRQPKDSPRLS